MRSLIIFCILFLLTTHVFAAHQYGSISAATGDIGKTDAFADRGGQFNLQNTIHLNTSSYVYTTFSKGITTAFGAYTIDGKGIKQTYSFNDLGDGRFIAVDENNNPIKFTAGSKLGFYVEDINGNNIFSTPGLQDKHSQNYVGTSINNKDEFSIGFGNLGEYVSSKDFSVLFDQSFSVVNVKISEHSPSGQPLPGVLISLAVCGSALCLSLVKRKTAF